MLKIEHLNYSYKKNAHILRDITLEIGTGFCFLVGENGSGKTTLMKYIADIVRGEGMISIDGISATDPPYHSKLAYLPQDFNVYPRLRVKEILTFVADLKGIEKAHRAEQVQMAAEKTNVTAFLDKKLKDCSGGMRRRVGIATTLIGSPKVVLLDEPTAGIDPKERFQFYQSLRECFSDCIVIISTHILDDAEILADSVIMLSHGQVKYQDKYIVFRHSLDGKVFEVACARDELVTLQKQSVVLDFIEQQSGDYLCRIIPHNPSQAADYTPVFPSIGDLWVYYQQGDAHEA